jgi:hypothetical protein
MGKEVEGMSGQVLSIVHLITSSSTQEGQGLSISSLGGHSVGLPQLLSSLNPLVSCPHHLQESQPYRTQKVPQASRQSLCEMPLGPGGRVDRKGQLFSISLLGI